MTNIFVVKSTAERLRILVEMDLTAFTAMLPPEAQAHLKAKAPELRQDTLLTSLHKARYEMAEIAPHLRHYSRTWLESHGHDRLRGMPWPPEGVLPE